MCGLCPQGVTQDREGYALAAGLALGLITLGKGRSAVGLADLHLEEKLRYGGRPGAAVGRRRPGYGRRGAGPDMRVPQACAGLV